MRLRLLVALLCVSTAMVGQTPLIAWKSHAGSDAAFAPALRTGKFDTKNHNLGMAPEPSVSTAYLDTVIYVDANTTIVVTSLQQLPMSLAKVCPEQQSLWKPGKDTIVNDTFWNCGSQSHIMHRLDNEFYFSNPVSSTVFIGFPDNSSKGVQQWEDRPQEERVIPFSIRLPHHPSLLIALAGVGLLVLLTVFASSRWPHYLS